MAKKLIRFAVAIDINGEWTAAGWSVWGHSDGSHNAEDDYMSQKAAEGAQSVRGGDRGNRIEVQFVEVEIDIPLRLYTVKGKVVQ